MLASLTEHAAITIIEAAQSEGWTRGLNPLHRIPDRATADQINALGPEVTDAIEQVGIRVETIGYMVGRGIVDIQMVDDLFGGVVIFWWSRIRPFAERDRERTYGAVPLSCPEVRGSKTKSPQNISIHL